jgi:tetratricopeptide (TPR) repeat protein
MKNLSYKIIVSLSILVFLFLLLIILFFTNPNLKNFGEYICSKFDKELIMPTSIRKEENNILYSKYFVFIYKQNEFGLKKKELFHKRYLGIFKTFILINESSLGFENEFSNNQRTNSDNNYNFYYNRGYTYFKQHQFEKAMNDFNKSIELNSNCAEAYLGLSTINIESHNFDKAISCASKAILINSNFAIAYNARASAYFRIGKFDKALEDEKMAISIDPNVAEFYTILSAVLFKKNIIDRAFININKSINLDSQNVESQVIRGLIYLKQKNLKMACKDWKKAKELGGKDVENLINKYCNK